MFYKCPYVDFTEDDINNATDDNNEVKHVPWVSKVALHNKTEHLNS